MRRVSVKKNFWIIALAGCVLLSMASCATHKDSLALRAELNAFRNTTDTRLTTLEQTLASIDSLIREQNQLSLGMRASLGVQNQDQGDRIAMIAARQDELNSQLRDLLSKFESIALYGGISAPQTGIAQPDSTNPAGQLPTTRQPGSAASFITPQPKVDPEELYKSAIDDINRGSYALAESRLLTFLIQFPEHELAGNAQYWLGESAFGQEKYDVAIQEFDKLLNTYKKSPKVPAALLKKGLAQINSGDRANGKATLNLLIKTYPKAVEVKEAKEALSNK
jgi:tol-pal system protein YbgF